MSAVIARLTFRISLAGVVCCAAINLIAWLPIDVRALSPIAIVLFIGVFPTWFVVIGYWTRQERQNPGAVGPRGRFRAGPRLTWNAFLGDVPRWALTALGIAVAYVFINFFASILLLPGQPVESPPGTYYFDAKGHHIATDLSGYLNGMRVQLRLLTGHPMLFYAIAAVATYPRRGSTPVKPDGDGAVGAEARA